MPGPLRLGAAPLALLLILAPAGPAAPASESIKNEIESAYGVVVLRMEEVNRDGRKVVSVTVLTPGGDFNDGYQTNVLLVDAKTGRLLPQFRHHASGYSRDDRDRDARGDDTPAKESLRQVRLPGLNRTIKVVRNPEPPQGEPGEAAAR